jgi:SAM-dependent methyltransferase
MITRPEINDFFRAKLQAHGATAAGVGWRDEAAQTVRFQQLLKVIAPGSPFTFNDLGCGTGEILELLEQQFQGLYGYTGYDIVDEMIIEARKQFPERRGISFKKISDYKEMSRADYSVASGIFNVRNSIPDQEWKAYILDTLSAMSAASSKGFAFNALTTYSDKDKMRPDLFYSDPLFLFDYCKRNFSKEVALLHDYGIYDFTILVRK